VSTVETYESRWEVAYNDALATMLEEYARNNIDAAKTAFEEFVSKIDYERGWFGSQGPFGYQVAWKGEKMVAAEVKTLLATLVKDGSENDVSPTDVLAQLDKACRQMVSEGLTSSSTSILHNAMAQARGRAALEESTSSFSGFNVLAERARWTASRQLTDDLRDAVQAAHNEKRELELKYDRARSDSTREKLANRRDEVEGELRSARNSVAVRLSLAGAPDEVVQPWLDLD
jgi:hypothetical protein